MSATLPTQAQWDAPAEIGRASVLEDLAERILTVLRGEQPVMAAQLAIGLGAMVATAEMLRDTSNPGSEAALEGLVVAHVRAAIRGLREAVNEDGSPYRGSRFDA